MVNEFMSHSLRKSSHDKNDGESASMEKPLVGESSDEDTTSSSLLPLPDTLDVMRNELKSTINNICSKSMDFEECPKELPYKVSTVNLNPKFPTDREVSIARKITSANMLLDDLLNNSNILATQIKDTSPLVFTAKTSHRQMDKRNSSETGTDNSTESSSTASEHCPSIPVTPFVIPNQFCDHGRCFCNRQEPMKEHQTVGMQTSVISSSASKARDEAKKKRNRCFLSEKMRGLRCRKRKKSKSLRGVDESLQTQTDFFNPGQCAYSEARQGIPQYPLEHQSHLMRLSDLNTCPLHGCPQEEKLMNSNCMCKSEPRPQTECNCPPIVVSPSIKECFCEERLISSQEPAKDISLEDMNISPQFSKKPEMYSETKLPKPEKIVPVKKYVNPRKQERIDIYYFDHGNSAYYRTTDSHPAKYTEYLIERTDEYTTKFWAEIFGTLTLVISFIISFILQLYRCLFTAIIRALTVGLIQIFSDYFFKPFLTIMFNGIIQPFLILGYNIATSTRDFCVPVCEIFEFCAKDLAIVFKSCRLVEINHKHCTCPTCHCGHNV